VVDFVRPPPSTSDREDRITRLTSRADSHLPLFPDPPPLAPITNGFWLLLRAVARGVSYDPTRRGPNKWRVLLRSSVASARKVRVRRKRQHVGWFGSEVEAIRVALTWSPPVDDSS